MAEPEQEQQPPPPEESPLAPALRAGKAFITPFLFSWAVAFVGSRRDIDWLHYTGLAGVALCMIGLFLWLIRT